MNVAQAIRHLDENGGLKTALTFGRAGNLQESKFNMDFMNLNEVSQTIDQPMRFTASLGNGPAAQVIRTSGTPIYVYATTQIALNTEYAKEGKRPRTIRKPVRLEGRKCDGYRFVLSPANGYSVALSGVEKVTIRKAGQSTATFIISMTSKEDWKVTGAEGEAKISAVRNKPFMVVDYGSRYINPGNYGPAHVVGSQVEDACTIEAHKEAFKAVKAARREVRSAPKAPANYYKNLYLASFN